MFVDMMDAGINEDGFWVGLAVLKTWGAGSDCEIMLVEVFWLESAVFRGRNSGLGMGGGSVVAG
jgi:hypothetical protein